MAASSSTPAFDSDSDAVDEDDDDDDVDCATPSECLERLERTAWANRTVVPAMDGIGSFLPERKRARVTTARDTARS